MSLVQFPRCSQSCGRLILSPFNPLSTTKIWNSAEKTYSMWRKHIQKSRDKVKQVFTPRGNSLRIALGGLTDRAGDIQTPRVSSEKRPRSIFSNKRLFDVETQRRVHQKS